MWVLRITTYFKIGEFNLVIFSDSLIKTAKLKSSPNFPLYGIEVSCREKYPPQCLGDMWLSSRLSNQ